MRLNLFYIPREILGWPVFGAGWLLLVWVLVSAVVLYRHFRWSGWSEETVPTLISIGITGAAIWLILPALVEEAGLPIRGYGAMLVIAIFAAIGLAMRRARRVHIDPDLMISLSIALVGAGIGGARLFFVIQHWPQFQKPSLRETIVAILSLSEGGLVVYGSLIGGALALWWFVRRHHLPGLALADLTVPSVVLGMGLGRIGCFFTGCCFGGACDLPWAVTFPWGSPPHVDQAERGELALDGLRFDASAGGEPVVREIEPGSAAEAAGVRAGDRVRAVEGLVEEPGGDHRVVRGPIQTRSIHGAVELIEHARPGEEIALWLESGPGANNPAKTSGALADPSPAREVRWRLENPPHRSARVHPAQLYSAIDALLLCGFLLAYAPFQRRDGELLALMLTLHPISRFLLEIIRTDEPPVWGTPLSISQNLSIVMFVAGIALWGYLLAHAPRRALVAAQPA